MSTKSQKIRSAGRNICGKMNGLRRPALSMAFVGALTASASAGVHVDAATRLHDHATHADSVSVHGGGDGHEHSGGRCFSMADRSVMMDPNAPADAVAAMETLAADAIGARFTLGFGVWSSTATDGAIAPGERMTITYSFVPDGLLIQGFNGEAASASNLHAQLDANFPGGRDAWKAEFRQAFERWGEIINVDYVEVADDGATFQSSPGLLASGNQTGRGDVRIAMHPVGASVLAYNFYPAAGGDMVLDSQDITLFCNAGGDFLRLRNVLMHEHGHGLGIAHSLPLDNTRLMQPGLSTDFDGPQEDDIRAAHFLYGDVFEQNDSRLTAPLISPTSLRSVADAGVQVFQETGVALERDGAADFYAFTAIAGSPVAIRIDPVGTEYLSGPENGTPSTVNARAARDLALRLWRRVSAANNTFELFAQIDFNEAGESEYHPPIPYTIAGYFVAEVYSTDGVNDVQEYTITLSNSAIEAQNLLPPELLVTDGLNEITEAEALYFDATAIGQTSGKALLVRNLGEQALLFTGSPDTVTIQGPGAGDFVVAPLPAEIAGGGQFFWGITFQPVTTGQRVAVVTLPNNDPDEASLSFILSGSAVAAAAPAIEVRFDSRLVAPGNELILGDIDQDSSVQVPFSIKNTGTATLNVSAVQFAGAAAAEFVSSLGSAILAPGATSNGALTFAASEAGVRTATMTFVSNAQPAQFTVTLEANVLEGAPQFDCNGNGVEDAEDIAAGTSEDCDSDGVPDACQNDSDGDGVIDACDVDDDDAGNGQDAGNEGDADEDNGADQTGDNGNDGENNDAGNAGDAEQEQQDNAADNAGEQGDENADEQGDDGQQQQADPNEVLDGDEFGDDLTPILPGPGLCGFGALAAAPLCMASIAGAKRTRRGIRRVQA